MNILIVDDDIGDRLNLQRECEKSGLDFDLFEAENVADSLQVIQDSHIDCVLMDYALPGENGLTGLSLIRKDYPYLPVIMVTCYGDEVLASNAFKSGASDYLPKDHIENLSWKLIVEEAVSKATIQRELDETREYLTHFSDMLAHDLLSPIGQMVSFVELAENFRKDNNDSGLEECLKYIDKSAHNLKDLILAVSEYAQGGKNCAMEIAPLQDAVNKALEMLAQKITARGAIVTQGSLPNVLGNTPLLSQAFMNLIANGIKFNRSHSPAVDISSTREGDNYLISITDNGIGIPEESLDKIFKPFSRGHNRREFPGSGLGLSTVQRIIERHGGRIRAENGEHGGAVFTIELPAPAQH